MSKQKTTSTRGNRKSAKTSNVPANRRPLVVFLTLVAFLTGTSALLLALARPPMTPDGVATLYATETSHALDAVFNTTVPATPSRWNYIFVHHSQTPTGNALTLAQPSTGVGDHFVVGNGEGALDGEIQMGQRWNQQLPGAPIGANVDPACISICVIGDLDRALPTNAQVQRLGQLVTKLQHKLDIPGKNVILADAPGSPGGIGQYFPTTAFRSQLLP